jgi:large subunit ribosomal protein L24
MSQRTVSKKPRKQRKFVHDAPLHVRNAFLGCHLSRDLRKKYNTRSLPVRKGDKVKVLRGQFRGKSGTVERTDRKTSRAMINGIDYTKRDGTKVAILIHASNIMITELNTNDKKRFSTGLSADVKGK